MSSDPRDPAALIAALSDPVELTARLCDIPSVSGSETRLADAVEAVLHHISAGPGPELDVRRDGDTIVAGTRLGRGERVIVAGHLDTVPIEENLPSERRVLDGREVIWGRGACDMKAGVAMQLSCAHALREPSRDVTWIFYDHEEVEAALNGLGRVARRHPDWLSGDFAILGEPSLAGIEGGCNGTIRVEVTTSGVRAHSARAFKGVNAIHRAADILNRLADHRTETVRVDGLDYRESLSAVGIRGGVAGNVIPDECVVTVNYRFAPSTSLAAAEAFLREFFAPHPIRVTDGAEGARPGLDRPAAQEFVRAIGGTPQAKLGWTDVSRFSQLGIPAVNFGPGDAMFAHRADEHVECGQVVSATRSLLRFLEPTQAAGEV
ncbi:succinyl-diaminopimelate desuccinylase [Brevibacterium daeguense]|uniref:Succinyl-diaminopimelate desuccinylase n=1 Tax=Brevibacterium daeguense TaxID=909936 RepID=A0ABP8EJG8_9MICO|nr:succinyl-diaminopimelate desuccinylase [Brevibacterium daeguense]